MRKQRRSDASSNVFRAGSSSNSHWMYSPVHLTCWRQKVALFNISGIRSVGVIWVWTFFYTIFCHRSCKLYLSSEMGRPQAGRGRAEEKEELCLPLRSQGGPWGALQSVRTWCGRKHRAKFQVFFPQADQFQFSGFVWRYFLEISEAVCDSLLTLGVGTWKQTWFIRDACNAR